MTNYEWIKRTKGRIPWKDFMFFLKTSNNEVLRIIHDRVKEELEDGNLVKKEEN